MRTDSVDHSAAVELLPVTSTSKGHGSLQYSLDPAQSVDTKCLQRRFWQRKLPQWFILRDTAELLFFAAVLAHVVPIALLVVYAPRLSSQLGSNGCHPNGDFMIPGTANIWDVANFFIITLPAVTTSAEPEALPYLRYWHTFSYTQAKVIDIFWDVFIGRSGQIILGYCGYKAYSKSILYIMEVQTLHYETYSAVAFDTGRLRSLLYLLKGIWNRKFRTTWRGRRTLFLIILSSTYIVAMPTIFAAITGYSNIFLPSFKYGTHYCHDLEGVDSTKCAFTRTSGTPSCGGPYEGQVVGPSTGFIPGWGRWDINRLISLPEFSDYGREQSYGAYRVSKAYMDYFIGKNVTHPKNDDYDGLVAYYLKHQADYDLAAGDPRCQDLSSVEGCPPLMKESTYIRGNGKEFPLSPPLIGLERWNTDLKSAPEVWLCGDILEVRTTPKPEFLRVGDNSQYPLWGNETNPFNTTGPTAWEELAGVCSEGAGYIWGFSFLGLFVTCILQFAFSVILFALWIEGKRYVEAKMMNPQNAEACQLLDAACNPSTVSSVLAISTQIDRQYGAEARVWNSEKLRREIWQGDKGMQYEESVKPW